MITLIWAQGPKREIGLNGKLPWKCPEDIMHFKKRIKDRPIIVGRRTYSMLPLSVLHGHSNTVYIMTTDESFVGNYENHVPFVSLAAVNDNHPGEEIMVIGGATTYEEFQHVADRMVVTEITPVDTIEADTFVSHLTHNMIQKSITELSDIAMVHVYERY